MARLTRRETIALGATTLLSAAVVVTALVGQTRAALALTGVVLGAIAVLVVRNNRAISRTRRALDWLARPTPTSTTSAPPLPEPFEQMLADVDSVLKGLQRDLETIRFGQTVLTQTTGGVARDLADLSERHDELEVVLMALRDATVSHAGARDTPGPGTPVSPHDDARG